MSTKRWSSSQKAQAAPEVEKETRHGLRAWFDDLNFLKKFGLIYLVCAVLPMLLMSLFAYQQTSALLTEEALSSMRQGMTLLENSLNDTLQPFETISRMLATDRLLNTQMSLDYTNLSYSDIAYYQNTQLRALENLNPGLEWIRFYSSNNTLPQDNYYTRLNKLSSEAAASADALRGQSFVSCCAMEEGEDVLVLLARMDYYTSDRVKNYVALGIDRTVAMHQMTQRSEDRKLYLLDSDGRVLVSSGGDGELAEMESILPGWFELAAGKIEHRQVDGRELLCVRESLDYGMTLVMTVDRDSLLRNARQMPLRMASIFLLVTVIAMAAVYLYSRGQEQRLQQIVTATDRIGEGDFADARLPDLGRDELGTLAAAVNEMNGRIDRLIRENYQRQLKVKSSEVDLLQEQINPHFLYNALSVISSIAMQEGGRRTVQSVRYLSDFYRLSLNKGKQIITVGQEVELLQDYMKIQMLRFEDTVAIDYDVDESVLSCSTIKLILQPLVENAIHHARMEDRLLHIHVRVTGLSDRIRYEVADDGAGIEPEKLRQLQEELTKMEGGFGLKNVDIRVRLNYGDGYGVSLESNLGEGTRVQVEIPRTEK